ncbi:MAG TPA: DUF1611 domain-containing protein [Planctomycetaceae bacterium]|nr:DUF1611 domain-containing protein [Planctomycetaceae bacterium]
MNRRIVLLTWGHSNPRTAKTATGLLRYCPSECVAIFDPDNAGMTAGQLLEIGGDVPVIGQLADAPPADTLVIGIAPPGGKIPEHWRPVLMEAIAQGMNILSGLHDFLSLDEQLMSAAEAASIEVTDVRRNNFRSIARRTGFNDNCTRLHTVGHDCSVGKMLVSLETSRGLSRRGHDAHFVATGQTGIMVSGEGLPIDCVAADFVSGAAEKLVLDKQHHDVLVVEGQGSLVHPSYSAVTLGLLHGCQPHGLIFVFEAGRETVGGLEHVQLPSLAEQRRLFETMGSIYQECSTVAFAMNGRLLTPDKARKLADQIEDEQGLAVVDVVREGPVRLLDAVEAFIAARE